MAHWDEDRDRRWILMMRATALPLEPIILKFEQTGDIIYWHQFIEEMRHLIYRGDFTYLRNDAP